MIMIARPADLIGFIKNGMTMCYEVVIPGLFPFFVMSGLLIFSGFPKLLARIAKPFMRPLFNINENGAAAFVIGLISGYPSGAATACDLYETGYVSKSEAERLMGFCNNSGPLFIIGSVGAAMYSSVRIGAMLYAAHVAASIITGIILRFYAADKHHAPEYRLEQPPMSPVETYSAAMHKAVENIIFVCAAVIFWSAVTELLFSLLPDVSGAVIGAVKGLFEFTTGIRTIAAAEADLADKLALTAFSAGFAGLCVHMQVIGIAAKKGLSVKPYIIGKLIHGTVSAVLVWTAMHFAEVRETAAFALDEPNGAYTIFAIGAALCVCACIIHKLRKGNT